jgi:hypothetical protein
MLSFAEGHLRKAVGDDQMPFSFDELLNWARSLVMVIDHRIKTPETMEVLKSCQKCSFLSIKRNQTVEKETGNAHRII